MRNDSQARAAGPIRSSIEWPFVVGKLLVVFGLIIFIPLSMMLVGVAGATTDAGDEVGLAGALYIAANFITLFLLMWKNEQRWPWLLGGTLVGLPVAIAFSILVF